MFREVNYIAQGNGCGAARAALENLERADTITREVDVFAFGMLVMEVRSCTTPLALRLKPTQDFCEKRHVR